jgi:predicted PurR-regulated permease PerM
VRHSKTPTSPEPARTLRTRGISFACSIAGQQALKSGARPASGVSGGRPRACYTAPMPERESPRALIAWTVFVLVGVVAAAWALYLVRQVLVLIYVSGLLAIGFNPLVGLIERQPRLMIGTRIPRWLAILIVYLAILGVLAGIAAVILPPFVTQAHDFATHLPDLVDRGQRWLVAHGMVKEQKTFGEIVEQTPGGTDVVGTMLFTVWGLFGGILGVVSIVILTFYLLVDSESVFHAIVRLFPRDQRLKVHTVSRQITGKVSAWLLGQLMLSAIIGTTSAIWLGILGIPYFYVLALIAAIGELVPIVGPILAALPGIAIAATISWKLAAIAALLYLAQQQLEANVLVPKMMERQVGLTPVAIMIALLLGGALLGIPGAILAVPTAAIIQVVLQEVVSDEG